MAQSTFRLQIDDRNLELKPGEITFGRTEECSVMLEDAMLSRVHARLVVSETEVVVEDLGSKNGTFVNEQRISEPVRLYNGDQVRVGRTIMQLSVMRVRTKSAQAQIKTMGFRTRLDITAADSDPSDVLGRLIQVRRFDEAAKVLKSRVAALTSAPDPPAVGANMPRTVQHGMLSMAEATMENLWLHRLFKLHVACDWFMDATVQRKAEQLIRALGGVEGGGLEAYLTHWSKRTGGLEDEQHQALERLSELAERE